jgi:hypothetical protein
VTVALALVFVGAMLIWTGIAGYSVQDAFRGNKVPKAKTQVTQ